MSTSYVNNYPTSGYASETQLRDEFTKVRDALLDTVSRTNSGSGSNAMEADLDLGSNDLLNVSKIDVDTIDASAILLQGKTLTPSNIGSVDFATEIQMQQGITGVLTDAEQVRRNHVAQVATIADLRNLEPAFDGQQVMLHGVGICYADFSDTSSADNGKTVFVTAGGKRWLKDQFFTDYDLGGMAYMSTTAGGTPHMLETAIGENTAVRHHIEPSGFIDEGTTTKYDWMFTPYDKDQSNYRIFNIFTKNGRPELNSGFNGENGVAYIGTKSVGDDFGVWPSVHFGFGDEQSPNSVPIKLYYFDTSDSEWREPMMGAWRNGRAVTSGDYMLASFKLYQAADSGVCGETKPSHTTGTVSDGNINWTFIRDFQTSTANIESVVLIGNRDSMPKFGLPGVRMQVAKPVAVWNGEKIHFLGSSGEKAISIYTNVGSDDLYIYSEKTGAFLRIDATGSFIQNNGYEYLMTTGGAITDGASSVSCAGKELIEFSNSVATNVTSFTGKAYQRFFVSAQNSNTTLVNGSNIKLRNGTNITLSGNDVLQFVFNNNGTIARQVL